MLQMRLSTNSSENGHLMEKMPFVKQEAVELCRICETVDNLLDISTEEFSHLYEKLHKIADFEGDYSVWLKYICVSCGTKLENAFDFKIQCEDTFRKLVTQMENNVADPFYPFSEELQEMSESNNAQQRDKTFFEIYELPEQKVENSIGAHRNASYNEDELNQPYYSQQFTEKRRNFTNSAFSGGNSMKMSNVAVRNVEKPKNSFSCAICSETFKEKWKMREHMHRAHMIRKRNICGGCGGKACVCAAMSKHPQKSVAKPFQCKVCGRGFRTKSYMELHEKEHDVSSKLRSLLNQGPSSAYRQVEMMQSMQQQNESDSPKMYKCQYCDKAFHRRQGLRMHYQVHTDERPYPCSYCEKRFRCRSHLNRHIYTHTGEKKYKCLVCHKSFTQSGSLRIHMRIHTGELPYECPNCLMRFRVRKTLLNHISRCPPISQERYK